MEKKQLTLVVVSLLVVVLSVSVAYFTAQIIGEGKNVSVTSANLQVIFTDTDGAISDTSIEPGWTSTKTFTVKNNTKTEYKYNIVLKDLVNTFVTNGYLQYKITSTNGGYNMSAFMDIPKSSTETDKILAYSVLISSDVTQSYTIEFKYTNDENVDQSDDMGMKLSGNLFITEGTETPTLYTKLLEDKSTRPGQRTDFSDPFTTINYKTLYTTTEDNTTVYYFSGNAQDNWVKFGKDASNNDIYWRIIRTNSNGSIRLLYVGTATDTIKGYSDITCWYKNSSGECVSDSENYSYYTYDNVESEVKKSLENWYKDNLLNFDKYIDKNAIYCNDKEYQIFDISVIKTFNSMVRTSGLSGYNTSTWGVYYNGVISPSLNCNSINSQYTDKTSSNGNKLLNYPIALITADEITFAGGSFGKNGNVWFNLNSNNETLLDNSSWWTMSPGAWNSAVGYVMAIDNDDDWYGRLHEPNCKEQKGIRPVTSLKSCVKWGSGDGSAGSPYTIDESFEC